MVKPNGATAKRRARPSEMGSETRKTEKVAGETPKGTDTDGHNELIEA